MIPAWASATPKTGATTTPVGVALVGYGVWGAKHARAASSSDGLRLIGVVEPDDTRRSRVAAEYGTATWSTLEMALRDPAVEAVVIATPASTHLDLALKALRAGRHVLVEKPAAMSLSGALTLVGEAKDRRLQLAAGHTFLYSQPIRNIAAWLRTGKTGPPRVVHSERLGARQRADCDVMWNLAPHDVSILLHLIDGPVVEVAATAHAFPGSKSWDVATIDLRCASGMRGLVRVGWRCPGRKRALRLWGGNWVLRYRDGEHGDVLGLVLDGERADRHPADLYLYQGCSWSKSGLLVGYPEPLRVELKEFAASCRSGRPPITGPIHLAAVTAVLDAASRSADSGGVPQRVDPSTAQVHE